MSAHTPGPWKATRKPDSVRIDGDGGYRHITYVCADEITEFGGERMTREQEANARLIAAAPDLLAALERAGDYFSTRPGGTATDRALRAQILDQMRAAIAKATGGGK